jgi:hypothetical protein
MDDARRKELEDVYRSTNYVVRKSESEIVIRIGELCPALDQLLEENAAASWAFLTAWNPYSQQLADEENATRQILLLEELRSRGTTFFPGAGIDANGEWPPEESVLTIGIELDEATALAKRFEQNAIVFGWLGEPPRLVWCA